MTSRSRNLSGWLPSWSALVFATALSPVQALAGDEASAGRDETAAKASPTRTVVVGKATLNWHLTPGKSAQRSDLVEAFRKATEAHLTGGEPVVTAKAEPVTLPGGQPILRLPAELIHTMFVDASGRNYCSDSTVPAKASTAANSDGEGR